jgi:signal transduction histidine kinase/CheY-like chemotaxis protein
MSSPATASLSVLELNREGLLDFWSVYERHYDSIAASTTAAVEALPELVDLMRSTSPEAAEAQRRESRERLRKAIVEGEWQAYEVVLKQQGAAFAQMGITLPVWHWIIRLFQQDMIPLLVQGYTDDPARLSRALVSMQSFVDRTMALIANEYLETKERAVIEQRELAERRAEQLAGSEESLRRNMEVFESVLRSMRDGVVVRDEHGTVLLSNRAADGLLGASGGSGSEPAPTSVFLADEKTPLPLDETPVMRALRGLVTDDLEVFLRTPPHPRGVHLSISGRPLLGADGSLRGGLAVFRDVTARREAEAATRRSLELEIENRQIQEATRMKSQFLASMSHELRTPLNAIIGFSELLECDAVAPGSPEYRQFVDDILSSGRHLLRLVNDVLDLAKVEAGRMEFHPEAVEPARLIDEVRGILRTAIAQKRVRLETQVAPDLGSFLLDAGRLKQVLYNYLSNAIKFTPEGGSITVRLLPEGDDRFRLEVEDSGVGIAPEGVERLFTEFQQVHEQDSSTGEGTGLGLALTRRLVEAQGGTVGVRSELGRGSTFHAVLPRQASLAELYEALHIDATREGGATVLVVEDDPHDRQALADALSSVGYGVVAVSTGAEALRVASERSFDAATVDLLLPDMSGLDVIRALRSDGRHARTPVVVVTVVAERGAVAGVPVQSVLSKPFEPRLLMQALRDAGVPPRSEGPILVIDDDPGSLRLMEAAFQQLGIACVLYSDGATALAAAELAPPAGFVVDLLMPNMDGFEFIDRLRRHPRHAQTPVVVWTSKDLDGSDRARLRATSQAIVTKGGGGASAVTEHLRLLGAKAQAAVS